MTHVHSLVADEGELRFAVTIAGRTSDLFVRVSEPVVPGADVALALVLLPAMTIGGILRLDAPVDEGLLRRVGEIQAVLRAWQRTTAWRKAAVLEHEVELECPVRAELRRPAGRPVAAFFSGGVDSFATVEDHPEITHLIYVAGFDLQLARTGSHERVRERLDEVASRTGRSLITAETNARQLSDSRLDWSLYFGSAMAGVARALADAVSRVYIAGDVPYRHLRPNGSHPLLDHLWGGPDLELVHDGAARTRTEKVELIAEDPIAHRGLRVCWQGPRSGFNCGACEKCVRTMLSLELLGVRDRFETFPPGPLDLDAVAATRPGNRPEVAFWIENLELAVRRRAPQELIAAIESCLARVDPATRALALSPREMTAGAAVVPPAPLLHMMPETWRELCRRRAAIMLVGGYDGCGNYGDVAQLQGTLGLLGELGEEVLALPVIDLRYLDRHRRCELPTTPSFDPAHILVFAYPGGDADRGTIDAGLVPAALPASTAYAATYLYGGGYLNARWAARMLDMVVATQALGGGAPVREMTSSGLQIEPSWALSVAPDQRRVLRRLRQLGVRDPISAQAAAEIADDSGLPAVSLTGDDSVGTIVRSLGDAPRPGGGQALTVNLHICAEPWVTDDPTATLAFIERFLDGLGDAAGKRLHLQPVIAYDDGRVSERPRLRSFTSPRRRPRAVAAVAEPIALSSAQLGPGIETLRRAALTVSCSYHVSLTSLLAGVPAVLLFGNDYYAQKADGLCRDFALGSEFLCDTRSEPREAAAAIVARLAGGGEAQLSGALDGARERVMARRRKAEAQILSQLRAGIEGARAPADDGRPAVPEPGYEALLGTHERLQRALRAASEQVAWQEAHANDLEEMLKAVERSRAWRWTAPLRSAKRRLARAPARRREP